MSAGATVNNHHAAARRQRFRLLLGYFFFMMFIVFVGFQFWNVNRVIQAENQEFRESQITYGELLPDKSVYTAGEVARFTFTRTTAEHLGYPILLLICDGFENVETGEVFPGILAPRVIKNQGAATIHATRQISPYATTGTYIFQGWSQSQTGRPNRAIYYASKTFKVNAKK